jgi:hypothetical protein
MIYYTIYTNTTSTYYTNKLIEGVVGALIITIVIIIAPIIVIIPLVVVVVVAVVVVVIVLLVGGVNVVGVGWPGGFLFGRDLLRGGVIVAVIIKWPSPFRRRCGHPIFFIVVLALAIL